MGSRFGDYALLEALGSGPSGQVWIAESPVGERVRLKVSRPGQQEAVGRFERIARSWTEFARNRPEGLETPVATVLPGPDGRFAVATSWIDGPTLDAIELDPIQRLEIGLDAARRIGSILVQVHDRGGAHGSLRPSNVLWTGSGPVLIDFFWAQAGLHGEDAYAAPERPLHERATPEQDQWAWAQTVRYVVGTASSQVPELSRLLDRAQEPDPNLRHPSMAEALQALAAVERTVRTDDVSAETDAPAPTEMVEPPSPARVAASRVAFNRIDASETATEDLGAHPVDLGRATEPTAEHPVPDPSTRPRRRSAPRLGEADLPGPVAQAIDPTTTLPRSSDERASRLSMVLWAAAVGLVVAAAVIFFLLESSSHRPRGSVHPTSDSRAAAVKAGPFADGP